MPLTAIQLLLDMVRGQIPFALVPAIKAALEIASYLAEQFDLKVIARTDVLPMAATPDFGLEACLQEAINQHERTTAYFAKHTDLAYTNGVSESLLLFILQEVLKWIADRRVDQ